MPSIAISLLKKKLGKCPDTVLASQRTTTVGLLLSLLAACSPLTSEPIPSSSTAISTVPPSTTPTPKSVPTVEITTTPTNTPKPNSTTPPATSILETISPGQYVIYLMQDNLYFLSPDHPSQGEFVLDVPDPDARLSLDNQYIAFSTQLTSPPWYFLNIFDIRKDTKNPIQHGAGCADPAWAPDGKLAAACDGEIYLWISPFDNREKIQLTNCRNFPIEGSCNTTTWSPNGKWIAYDNNTGSLKQNGIDGLYLMDTACLVEPVTCPEKTLGPLAFLYPGQAGLYARAWSPDGRYLAMQGAKPDGGLKQEIWFLDTETGKFTNTPIILNTSDEPQISSMAWSPDGNWIAYSQSTGVFVVSLSDKNPRRLTERPSDIAFWVTIP